MNIIESPITPILIGILIYAYGFDSTTAYRIAGGGFIGMGTGLIFCDIFGAGIPSYPEAYLRYKILKKWKDEDG